MVVERNGLKIEYRDGLVVASGNTYPARYELKKEGFRWDPSKKIWVQTATFGSENGFRLWASALIGRAFSSPSSSRRGRGARNLSWREAFRNGRCPLCGGELYEGAEFDGVSYDIWVCANCGASFSERGRLLSKGR